MAGIYLQPILFKIIWNLWVVIRWTVASNSELDKVIYHKGNDFQIFHRNDSHLQ